MFEARPVSTKPFKKVEAEISAVELIAELIEVDICQAYYTLHC